MKSISIRTPRAIDELPYRISSPARYSQIGAGGGQNRPVRP